MNYHIGCSGYNYQEWKGIFYPDGLAQSKWLEFYCLHYNTVEINASFYKFPTLTSLQRWYAHTPKDFKFSVKANSLITHYKKFRDAEAQIAEFYDVVKNGLREKLACVLFQFPPSLHYHESTLNLIVSNLDPAFKNVVEFRDSAWWNETTYDLLKKENVIFCISSIPGLPDDFVRTAETIYIRFHGKTELYKSNYSADELSGWVRKIEDSGSKEAFLYFDNTWGGNAVKNAKEILQIIHTSIY